MSEGVRGRPQWGWLGLFAVDFLIPVVVGWSPTATIGASVGFVVTLFLVFAPTLRRRPRLPRLPWGWGVAWWVLVLLLAAVVGLIGYGTVTEGMSWNDAAGSVFLLALVLWPLRWVTVRLRRAARRAVLVAAGPLTPVSAAVNDVPWTITGRARVEGWAVLPNGLRTRLRIARCPEGLSAELLTHRRVWVVGEPALGDVVLGLPGTGLYVEAYFEAKRRHLVRLSR
jgi:hypothetical protein